MILKVISDFMLRAFGPWYSLPKRQIIASFRSVASEGKNEREIDTSLLATYKEMPDEACPSKLTPENIGVKAKSLALKNKFTELQTLIDYCNLKKLYCGNIIVLRVHEAERKWKSGKHDEAMELYSYLVLNLKQKYRRKIFNNLKFYFLHILAGSSEELHQKCTELCINVARSSCYRPLVIWWDLNFRSSVVKHNIKAGIMCLEFRNDVFHRIIDSKLQSTLEHCLALASQRDYDAFQRFICCALQYDIKKWKSVSFSYFLLCLCSMLDLQRAREVWLTAKHLKIEIDPIAVYSYRKALEITKSPHITEVPESGVAKPVPQIKYNW